MKIPKHIQYIAAGVVTVGVLYLGYAELSKMKSRISTIGRGGSDTTAVAIASKLSADRCDIHTDVEGVFTTDPRWVKKAKKIDNLTYEEMLEMASVGAQVLDPRSVSLAKKNNISLFYWN